MRNPWIEPWLRQFGSDAYFAQLPVHPHMLGLWLKIWGVSTASLLAFQCLAGCTTCMFSVALLRKSGCPPWAVGAGCAVAAAFILDRGLRTEPWAASFALAAVWAWWGSGRMNWTYGALAAAMSIVIHPFALVIVLPALLVTLFFRWADHAWQEVLVCLGILAAIGLGTLALLAWLVDFRISEFWTSFRAHALMRTPAPGNRLASFWEAVTLGHEPWLKAPVALAFGAAVIASWRDGNRQRAATAVFAVTAGLSLGIASYAGNSPLWLWPVASGLALALWAQVHSSRQRKIGAALTVAGMLWGISPQVLHAIVERPEPSPSYMSIRTQIDRLHPTRLLVDETSARFIYDFALPAGAHDWLLTRRRDSGMLSSLANKPEGEVWLVDARKVSLYVPDARLVPSRVSLPGFGVTHWLAHPYEGHLFP